MSGEVLDHHWGGVEVIDRDIEEALNLRRVQINGQNSVRSGSRDQIRYQSRGDGNARPILLVPPGISIIRNDRRDSVGR